MEQAQKIRLVEELRQQIWHGHIQTIDELTKACEAGGLDWYDDVCEGIGWNACDRCGRLGYSEEDLLWLDYAELEPDEYEDDKHLIDGLDKEGGDYSALCWDCVKELQKKGE